MLYARGSRGLRRRLIPCRQIGPRVDEQEGVCSGERRLESSCVRKVPDEHIEAITVPYAGLGPVAYQDPSTLAPLEELLDDKRPDVAGRACNQMRHRDATPET